MDREFEEFEEFDSEERPVFEIDNDSTADWAVGKIKDANAETERLVQIAEAKIRELEARIVELRKDNERKTSYLKERLMEYFGKVEKKKTATQESYKLLSGTLYRKYGSAKMVKDDEKLLDYFEATGQNEFIKVKRSPDWAEFKKRCVINGGNVVDAASGEVIECVSIEEVPEKFDIKF